MQTNLPSHGIKGLHGAPAQKEEVGSTAGYCSAQRLGMKGRKAIDGGRRLDSKQGVSCRQTTHRRCGVRRGGQARGWRGIGAARGQGLGGGKKGINKAHRPQGFAAGIRLGRAGAMPGLRLAHTGAATGPPWGCDWPTPGLRPAHTGAEPARCRDEPGPHAGHAAAPRTRSRNREEGKGF
jgi:hypothetical protein